MTDSKYEREKWLRSLFTAPLHNCGYQLSVNNPTINALYEDYIKRYKIFRPMSDKQRISFEKSLWKFFRQLYRRFDPKLAKEIPPLPKDGRHISEVLFGWRYEQFEIFINDKLDIQKTVELFRRVKIEVAEND